MSPGRAPVRGRPAVAAASKTTVPTTLRPRARAFARRAVPATPSFWRPQGSPGDPRGRPFGRAGRAPPAGQLARMLMVDLVGLSEMPEVALDSMTVIVSLPSDTASPSTRTVIVVLWLPGSNVRVPLALV